MAEPNLSPFVQGAVRKLQSALAAALPPELLERIEEDCAARINDGRAIGLDLEDTAYAGEHFIELRQSGRLASYPPITL